MCCVRCVLDDGGNLPCDGCLRGERSLMRLDEGDLPYEWEMTHPLLISRPHDVVSSFWLIAFD